MDESSHSRRYVAALSLIIFAAFVLRMWNLGTQSLWHDEAWSIFSAYHPLAFGALGTDPNSPPAFFLTLGAWLQAVGDSVWALRYWSLVIGIVTIPVTAFVARRWFGDRIAIGTAFLVAVSPILWVYSQEIRAYIALPLYAVILLALLDNLLHRPERRVWIWMLLVELLALYTHNLAVPLVAWLNIVALAVWILRRDWRRTGLWLVAQAGMAIIYLPWLLSQRPTGTVLNTPPAITLAVVWNIWQSYFTGVQALLNADPQLTALVMAIGVAALIAAIAALAWGRSARLYLLVSQALMVPVFELALIQVAHIDFHPRYFIGSVPATLMLIVVGMEAIRGKLAAHSIHGPASTVKWSYLASQAGLFITVLLAAAVAFEVLRLIVGNAAYQHDDFRTIAEHYASLTSDDAIVIPYGWEPTLAYYAPKLGIRAPIVGIPLGSSWQAIASQLNALHAENVEVLTWYQAPADLRGVYPCLLGATTQTPPSTLTVNGLTSLGYDRPGQIAPQLLPAQPFSFGLFAMLGTRAAVGERQACVISDWTLVDKTEVAAQESFRVTTGLSNPLGWLFTHSDADLRDDLQFPTQFWDEGKGGSSFTLLDYPAGIAAGNYPVVIGLYAANSLRGLDVILAGAPVGQSASVGALTITPAAPTASMLARFTFVPVTDRLSVVLPEGVYGAPCSLQPGQQFRVTALWRNAGTLPQTTVLRFGPVDWNLQQQTSIAEGERSHLAWYAFDVPAQAKGHAALEAVAPDGSVQTLQTCTITPSDHLFSAPPMRQSVGVAFAGVGTLAGFDLPSADVNHAGTFSLTLYWSATETPAKAYTVFTHLLDSTGHVIAQDDSAPDNGRRPTAGWVRGEYITDEHTLAFNVRGQANTGTATLEVGLYDPVSGKRVPVSNGSDHALLPVTLTVK